MVMRLMAPLMADLVIFSFLGKALHSSTILLMGISFDSRVIVITLPSIADSRE